MIAYLVNENQIVVAVMSIMLFVFVLLNISIIKQEIIPIYEAKEVGSHAMRFACTAFFGQILANMADVKKRLLKNFKEQKIINKNRLVRLISYPFWLFVFVIQLNL